MYLLKKFTYKWTSQFKPEMATHCSVPGRSGTGAWWASVCKFAELDVTEVTWQQQPQG